MKRALVSGIKRALRGVGLDLRRYVPPTPSSLALLLDRYGVDMLFDVGANVGQSGALFRRVGFTGPMISFEPIRSFYEQALALAADDPGWAVEKLALGAARGESTIHVSGDHGGASSMLPMTDLLREHAPGQRVVAEESIRVETLDTMMAQHYPNGDRCFVKLDVQGYERAVLEGGAASLHRVVGMQVEMSLVPSYEGETLLTDMLPLLYEHGYRMMSIWGGWNNPTSGEVFQVDALFARPEQLLSAGG